MPHPTLHHSGWFETSEIHVLPEALVILQPGLAQDGIRRIRYADMGRVDHGRVLPTFVVFLVILLGGIGAYSVATFTRPLLTAALTALVVFFPLTIVLRQRTVIAIDGRCGKIRFRVYGLSRKKADAFVQAIVDHVAREQGVPPRQWQGADAGGDPEMEALPTPPTD
ncbi:MAG: hypothetical protein LIP77_06260 [Planctomycetes bacterium]|nr:hypothetical protein [Planctomycetota bacterium]